MSNVVRLEERQSAVEMESNSSYFSSLGVVRRRCWSGASRCEQSDGEQRDTNTCGQTRQVHQHLLMEGQAHTGDATSAGADAQLLEVFNKRTVSSCSVARVNESALCRVAKPNAAAKRRHGLSRY